MHLKRTTAIKQTVCALGVTLFLVVGLASGAAAQSSAAADIVARTPALTDFQKEGGVVEYLGREGSLEGFALITKDQNLKTVYLTPEGTMVMGILVDDTGANLTAAQLRAYQQRLEGDQAALPGAEATDVSKAERVYAAAEKAAWVSVGESDAPYVYMFLNVNCDHCKAMFRDLQGAVTSGQVQLRLLPYGTADANREGGAALLSVADPAAAWLAYIKGDQTALSADKIAPGSLEKIAANTALVSAQKIKGPPFTLYRRPSDGVVTGMVGRPKNPLALVSDLVMLEPLLGAAPLATEATP